MGRRRGFTTMADLREYKRTTWSYVANITYTWQYDGMANLFRENDIPLYGIDLGSTRENHVFLAVFIPEKMNKNYGMNIFVPAARSKEAQALISDEKLWRAAALRESQEGPGHYEAFEAQAQACKARDIKLYQSDGGIHGDVIRRLKRLLRRSAAHR
ncbi:MAG: hypothetical protein LBD25_04595 [Coriobacteriales bacterium]|nr:hypothetical protein [Coriobacteriales bacterium]